MTDRTIGYCLRVNQGHELAGHPEGPHRFSLMQQLFDLPIASALVSLEPKAIDTTMLHRIHSPEYLEKVQSAEQRSPTRLDAGDTYVTKDSWRAALVSAGGAVAAAEYCLETNQPSFSLCRPPGHHATQDQALGFCLLNNIALAARHLQSKGLSRILIVDFDVHHGNGSQAIFERDPTVFYLSTHQRGIFPGTGHLRETGVGEGVGTVLNVPLPAYAGDEAFLSLFYPVLERIASKFHPEAILVSAGYDAHWQDPLANLLLSCATYHSLATSLFQVAEHYCEGRLALILEGGYNPSALFYSIQHTLYGLLSLPTPDDPLGEAPREEADISELLEQLLHD